MIMYALAVLPSPETMLADVGAWSGPVFSDLLPFAVYAIGIVLAFFLVRFLIGIFRQGFN